MKSGSGKGDFNIPLGYVLIAVGAAVFGFLCFLGRNFYTLGAGHDGNVIYAAVAAVILCVLASAATRFKHTYKDFKTYFILEMVSLALFLVAAGYFAYSDLSHYFVVAKHKAEIQEDIKKCVGQTQEMFAEYEKYCEDRIAFYEKKLVELADLSSRKSREQQYKEIYDAVQGASDAAKRDYMKTTLRNTLFSAEFDNMRQEDSVWAKKTSAVADNWKRIGIVRLVAGIDAKAKGWRDSLVKMSEYRGRGETAENFACQLSFDKALSDVQNRFRECGGVAERLTALGVLSTVALIALMLLYYAFSGRKFISKSGTAKIRVGYDDDTTISGR